MIVRPQWVRRRLSDSAAGVSNGSAHPGGGAALRHGHGPTVVFWNASLYMAVCRCILRHVSARVNSLHAALCALQPRQLPKPPSPRAAMDCLV